MIYQTIFKITKEIFYTENTCNNNKKLVFISSMMFDDKTAATALKYISGETAHVCRLCFAITDKKEILIEDTIKVKTSYCDESISITTMFHELGVSSESLLPHVLCTKCSTSTINAYLFQKLCQFSNEYWSNIIHRLSESLTQSDTVNSNTQSIYLVINKNENLLFSTRKGNSCMSKKTALMRLSKIMKSRSKYIKIKQALVDTICEECGERFTSSVDLIKHLKVHNKLQNPCHQCHKVFSTPLQLEEHAERVHYPKKLQCPKCPKKFSTKKTLKIHERTHHITAVCKICHMKFPSRKELWSHNDMHLTKNCMRCKKKFRNRHTLRLHLKSCGNVDDNQVKFICDICNKGYIRKNGIRTHLKTDHGFGKVISCNWCNKKFDAVSRLKNHIIKHTKEKNFHCKQCGGKFGTQAALIYHIRLHTGERPFPCDLCNESFLSASRRTDHKRRKHFGPSQECHICHVKFITGHQLRKHVQRHYNPHSKLYVSEDGIKMGNLLPIV